MSFEDFVGAWSEALKVDYFILSECLKQFIKVFKDEK